MEPERVRAYLQAACAGLGFDIGEIWWTSSENGSSTVAAIGASKEPVIVVSSGYSWEVAAKTAELLMSGSCPGTEWRAVIGETLSWRRHVGVVCDILRILEHSDPTMLDGFASGG